MLLNDARHEDCDTDGGDRLWVEVEEEESKKVPGCGSILAVSNDHAGDAGNANQWWLLQGRGIHSRLDRPRK